MRTPCRTIPMLSLFLLGIGAGGCQSEPTAVDPATASAAVVPFVVTASVPGRVTVKATYPLNGSANAPATAWKWERSDNGGASWRVIATTQNTSFVAFAGNYTIHWRLTARRVSDNAIDSDVRVTNVCTSGTCPVEP